MGGTAGLWTLRKCGSGDYITLHIIHYPFIGTYTTTTFQLLTNTALALRLFRLFFNKMKHQFIKTKHPKYGITGEEATAEIVQAKETSRQWELKMAEVLQNNQSRRRRENRMETKTKMKMKMQRNMKMKAKMNQLKDSCGEMCVA